MPNRAGASAKNLQILTLRDQFERDEGLQATVLRQEASALGKALLPTGEAIFKELQTFAFDILAGEFTVKIREKNEADPFVWVIIDQIQPNAISLEFHNRFQEASKRLIAGIHLVDEDKYKWLIQEGEGPLKLTTNELADYIYSVLFDYAATFVSEGLLASSKPGK
jgi:hypothetical protein